MFLYTLYNIAGASAKASASAAANASASAGAFAVAGSSANSDASAITDVLKTDEALKTDDALKSDSVAATSGTVAASSSSFSAEDAGSSASGSYIGSTSSSGNGILQENSNNAHGGYFESSDNSNENITPETANYGQIKESTNYKNSDATKDSVNSSKNSDSTSLLSEIATTEAKHVDHSASSDVSANNVKDGHYGEPIQVPKYITVADFTTSGDSAVNHATSGTVLAVGSIDNSEKAEYDYPTKTMDENSHISSAEFHKNEDLSKTSYSSANRGDGFNLNIKGELPDTSAFTISGSEGVHGSTGLNKYWKQVSNKELPTAHVYVKPTISSGILFGKADEKVLSSKISSSRNAAAKEELYNFYQFPGRRGSIYESKPFPNSDEGYVGVFPALSGDIYANKPVFVGITYDNLDTDAIGATGAVANTGVHYTGPFPGPVGSIYGSKPISAEKTHFRGTVNFGLHKSQRPDFIAVEPTPVKSINYFGSYPKVSAVDTGTIVTKVEDKPVYSVPENPWIIKSIQPGGGISQNPSVPLTYGYTCIPCSEASINKGSSNSKTVESTVEESFVNSKNNADSFIKSSLTAGKTVAPNKNYDSSTILSSGSGSDTDYKKADIGIGGSTYVENSETQNSAHSDSSNTDASSGFNLEHTPTFEDKGHKNNGIVSDNSGNAGGTIDSSFSFSSAAAAAAAAAASAESSYGISSKKSQYLNGGYNQNNGPQGYGGVTKAVGREEFETGILDKVNSLIKGDNGILRGSFQTSGSHSESSASAQASSFASSGSKYLFIYILTTRIK